MTMHRVEFNYLEPRWGDIELDLDPTLTQAEKEQAVIQEIKDIYGDTAIDIEIESIN